MQKNKETKEQKYFIAATTINQLTELRNYFHDSTLLLKAH